MKNTVVIVLIAVVLAGAVYYGFPILIKKATEGLRADIQDVRQRVQKLEEFVRSEEEARMITHLRPDADAKSIIGTLNGVASRVSGLEDSLKKNISVLDDAAKKQKTATEEALKEQSHAVDQLRKEAESRIRRSMFNSMMGDIRGHVLKVKIDLASKNVGTAKNEIALIDEALVHARTSASDEDKRVLEEFQAFLKKAKAEMDTDLPAAMNRIDLLWHEIGSLLRKG